MVVKTNFRSDESYKIHNKINEDIDKLKIMLAYEVKNMMLKTGEKPWFIAKNIDAPISCLYRVQRLDTNNLTLDKIIEMGSKLHLYLNKDVTTEVKNSWFSKVKETLKTFIFKEL